jgi:predicted DNA-binding transcriptional regulator AlpA
MSTDLFLKKPVQSALPEPVNAIVDPKPDPLLTPDDVAQRLNVSRDWVWDHSSRKSPFLPVIRVSDGLLRYRASQIEEFVNERERMSVLRRKRR